MAIRKTGVFWAILMLMGIGLAQAQQVTVPEPALFPSLISSIRVEGPLDFCGEKLPLDEREVKERLEKELLLSMWDRAQVILWLKRAGRYMPYIEKMLQKNRMPEDLKYVPIVESAMLPHIGSSKGAVGYWQFIPSTGRKYGLRINRNFDDRRNIFTATQAAIGYFKKLYSDFDSWTLAAAAYNMGEHGLARNIEFQGTRNYYHLYLPLETQRYIYKIVAAKLILSDPAKYGYDMQPGDYYQPIPFDRVQVRCPSRTPLVYVARAAETHYKTIKDLNPQIRGRYLPAGLHSLAVPEGAGKSFDSRYQRILGGPEQSKPTTNRSGPRYYVVRRGDSLSKIADRFDVPLSMLLRWNRLRPNSVIHPGDRLIVEN